MSNDPQPTKSKAEKLARSSFVLALGSIVCGITAIPAIVQSIRALVCIKKNGASREMRIKAIGSVMFSSCTLVFFVFCIVASLQNAQEMANDINCMNNLKQLALEIRLYQDGNNEVFPPSNNWCDAIQSTNTNGRLFRCPSAAKKLPCGYAMNNRLEGLKNTGEIPDDTVLLFESNAGWNASGGPELVAKRHHTLHVAYTDGSVQYIKAEDVSKLRWNPLTNSPAGAVR